jgi:polysaccharide export outer membrane protein
MTINIRLAIAFGVFFWAGCSASNTAVPVSQIPEVQADTTLGPGDLFDIRVFGEKDLSNTYRVASDGTIDLPLIGSLKVDGLTASEVKSLIEKAFVEGDFLKNPQVSILVKEYNSKKISVFGQVSRPGTFPYQDGMSVVEAISLAGGFTPMARRDDTTVTRVVDNKKRRYKVPVKKIGVGQAANFMLLPGDIVFVPERVF